MGSSLQEDSGHRDGEKLHPSSQGEVCRQNEQSEADPSMHCTAARDQRDEKHDDNGRHGREQEGNGHVNWNVAIVAYAPEVFTVLKKAKSQGEIRHGSDSDAPSVVERYSFWQ